MVGCSQLDPAVDVSPSESDFRITTACSIVHADTDHSFREIIMLTTFSMYACVNILMFGVVAHTTLKMMRQSPAVSAVRVKPSRITASSDAD
jgi:hypothetical protein